MKRARKSNRVSWATGANLCQVKLFLSEDSPSKVGLKSQDHLQAKASSMLQSTANEFYDLPPGFEGNRFLNQSDVEFTPISQIKWECASKFILNNDWRIAAGEESKEKENQKLREMRVLEAVYPRLSAIPPSPSVSLVVEEEDYDDNLTPLIPLIPIEEEESMNILPELARNLPISVQLQQHISATTPVSSDSKTSSAVSSSACALPLAGISLALEADVAAASAVVEAIMKCNEQGSLIDTDLLFRIFNDPIIIEKLINEHRTAAATVSTSSSTVGTSSGLKPVSPSVALSTPMPDVAASQITPKSTVGLPSVLKPPTLPVSFSKPAPDKQANPSGPFSGPLPGKPASPSILLHAPTPAPASHMHMPVHHMSNVPPALNAQPPQQDTVLASGVKRTASMASISNELSSVAMPCATGNLHAVASQVQSTATTMPYQPSTGSTFAVKDANYYKNLIRQHGADKHDMQDSQIGIRRSNFQDMKPVHNIKQGEVKHKIQKPCIYFKSSRGCRNGSSCPYQHDMSVQWGAGNALGGQNAKRVKLGPEV